MASALCRVLLLIWKNFLLQKRKVLVTIVEITLPAIFALILIGIRQRVQAQPYPNITTWPGFGVHKLPKGLCPSPECFAKLPWRLCYSPAFPATSSVMNLVKKQIGLSDVVGYDTEDAMVKDIMKDLQNTADYSTVLGGVIFYNWNASSQFSMPHNLTYKIRLTASPRNAGNETKRKFNPFGSDTRWFTTFQFPMFQTVGPRERWRKHGGLPGYWREGFLTVQHAVNKAITSLASHIPVSSPDVNLYLQRMPYPPYNDDNFVIVVQTYLPLLLMVSFVFSALHIVKEIVHEKEKKIKETLKLMGLPNWMHWVAWFIKHFLCLCITVLIMTVFFIIKVGKNGAIIGYSSPTVLFVFLLVYSMATIAFCFAVSVFFKKANTAAAAGGVLFFLTYMPYAFLQPHYVSLSWTEKMSTCLFSNVAMAYGGQILGMFEGTGAGIQWSTIDQSVSVDDDFTLLHVILMLLLDTFLYCLITWYVEAVKPGDYGIPQPWYFPVLRSYWCGTNPKGMDDDDLDSYDPQAFENIEKDPVGINAGIRIKGLRKEFGKGEQKNVAVAGMTLNMYEGQITALLGHNGAGKTTTMSMLTGFIPPTSGTAIINDYNIRTDITNVRENLGLCPQHDVLFDTLTVEEHLIFFAMVKGCSSGQVQHEVRRMLRECGLVSKKNALSKTLSGGQKRKLSVAIALIAGSKIVILDEPTSGMDPNARRHLWDVLQRHRAGRTMVLSTHFMDEADLLGDRVAIMADGVIQCCGSSLFLKNKYGAGYHLVIVKLDGCDVSRITSLIMSYVPEARLESNISAELSYVLPAERSDQFEALFSEIEKNVVELGIASFGASVTTMEEVFLRVSENMDGTLRDKLQQTGAMLAGARAEPLFNVDIQFNEGLMLDLQQFQAMIVKRMLHTARNWMVTTAQLLIPLLFTIIGLTVLKTHPPPTDSPALTLDLAVFRDNVLGYSSGSAANQLTEGLAKSYGERQQIINSHTQLDYLNNDTQYVHNPSLKQFLIDEGSRSLGTYINHYIVGAEFVTEQINTTNRTVGTAFFNNQAYHTPAVALTAIQNGIINYLTSKNLTLTTVNHPLPRTLQDKINDELSMDFTGFAISFHVMFGMAFLASSFVIFLIKERAIKAKHCQFVSGVGMNVFWLSTFCWDIINYLVPVVLLLITFWAYGITTFTEDAHLAHILLLFGLYGWACLPFMYMLSMLFTVPATGFVWLTMFNILSGIGAVMAVQILLLPQIASKAISEGLKWVFLALLPTFNLGQGLQDYYNNYQYLNICSSAEALFACNVLHLETPCCKGHCGDNCLDYNTNYLSWQPGGIGRMLVFLSLQGVVYLSIIFMVESGIFRWIWYWTAFFRRQRVLSRSNSIHSLVQEDDDVLAERQRIATMLEPDVRFGHTLVLDELTKSYGHLLAVDRLSLGIRQGQCFGLLGINGAGKTSTFKMLTGDETVTSGNAYLQGYDIKNNVLQVQKRLGYCPQFDALIDQLTGRETLTMYARLRGVVSYQIPGMVQEIIKTLLLVEHADKLVGSYSGGNKRKLSAAVALVGDPPVIFLDEPTTGMDPVARRLLWDTLSRLRASGSTLVLTSHSMEECEALCTQIAIMVNGQLKCLGSIQHLKTKFGEGYTLLAKVSMAGVGQTFDESSDAPSPNLQPLMEHIESTFPKSVLKDVHQGMLHYHIADPTISWAKLFGQMEKCKYRFHIEDYSVSQTTLDQVFINFARSQMAPQEESVGRCQRCRRAATWCCCCCSTCCSRCYGTDEEDDDEFVNIIEHEII